MFKDIYSFENKIVHGAYILKFFSAAHLMTFVNIQTILYGGGGGLHTTQTFPLFKPVLQCKLVKIS